MRIILSLAFAATLFSANAERVQAQSVAGPWSLHIPQIDIGTGPRIWNFQDAAAAFTATTVINIAPGIEIDGTLIGRKVFHSIYAIDASLTFKNSNPGVGANPALPTTKAVVFVAGNKMIGLAVDTLQNVPSAVYFVDGTRLVP